MNRIISCRLGLAAVLFATVIWNGFGQMPVDARSHAMGSLETSRQDIWAAANNPAELSAGGGMYAALAVANHYLVDGLNNLAFTLRYDFNDNGVGMAGCITGYQPFMKQWYALSYGRKLGKKLHAGLSLIYLNFRISGQGMLYHAATFKIGCAFHLSDNLRVSFCGLNPLKLAYSNTGNFCIPTKYITGFSYQATDNLQVASEVEAGTDLAIMIKAGLEYGHREKIFLRLGMMSSPFRITSGAGFRYSRFCLDISAEYHASLGFSPGISLVCLPYKIKGDEKH